VLGAERGLRVDGSENAEPFGFKLWPDSGDDLLERILELASAR